MFCHGFQALHTETVLDHRPHCCCGTLSYAFQRLAGAVTLDVRPEYKYDIRPQLGAIRQTETEREQSHNAGNAGNSAVKGESFVVPPVVPLSLLQGSFILGCWRGRYFVQYPTSAKHWRRGCVLRAPTPSAGFCVLAVLFVSRSMDLVSSVNAQRSYFWERKHWEEPVKKKKVFF